MGRTPTVSRRAQDSLRRVLGLRLAGAGLVAMFSLLAALAAVYTVQQARVQALWVQEARSHFERQVRRVETDWTRQADMLRAQVEFAGLLDDAEERTAALRFTAFFANLGGESTFTHVLVRTSDGREVARYATRSGSAEPPPADEGTGWSYSSVDGVLYRVLRAPVRLGRSARGEMLLFAPLNNALIDSVAFPDAGISLHWREHQDLATSSTYHEHSTDVPEFGAPPRLEALFAWAEEPDAPSFHVHRAASAVLPLSDLMVVAGIAAVGGALLAWLVIGRWAGRHVARIDALATAVDQFAAGRRSADALALQLEHDDQDSGVELNRLATGLADMMRTTDAAVGETAAARDHLAALNATLEARVAERTRELELARDEALAAVRARQRIMAGVSHELRTPLMGLLGTLELVHPESLQPEPRRLIEVARRSGQSLRVVVDDVLDYSRLEAVGASLHPVRYRPADLATEVVALNAAVALSRGLSLRCECDDDAHRPVLGDAARLRQVLMNIVGNALKFTDHGGVVLRVSGISGAEPRLRFEVEDSGIGMDGKLLERLFNPFVQADHEESLPRGGTGLGLSIAQRLVVAMGGRIAVTSTPGQGSTFSFDLPLQAADTPTSSSIPSDPAGPAESAAPAAPAPQRLRGRVLLVDDNAVNRMIAGEMLRRMGLGVEEAENGLLAIEALRRSPVDIVLMDQQMPVLDGVAATRRIRGGEAGTNVAGVPIIAVTAEALEGDADRCRAAGMNDHLSKPFSEAELEAMVRRWLVVQPSTTTVN